jgi:ankyrin repeat protein
MEACRYGHFEVVEYLLDQLEDEEKIKAAVNASDQYKNTPLKEALLKGNTRIISLLEQKGAISGRTEAELLEAALKCQSTKVESLLKKKPDINCRNRSGKTALMLASESGCHKVVEKLLEEDADINAKDHRAKTALILAAGSGHSQVVAALLDKGGADPNAGSRQGQSALIEATNNGHAKVVSKLLAKGANVNARDLSGATPLIVAVKEKETNIVKKLINDGKADIEATDMEGRTALFLAHLNGQISHIKAKNLKSKNTSTSGKLTDIEKILIKAGARAGWNEAELILAAYQSDKNWAKELIDEKTNVQAKDLENNTALLMAAKEGSTGIVQMLIHAGADADAMNLGRRTPLMEAAKSGHLDIIEVLTNIKSNVDIRDKNKDTALIEASRNGEIKIVTRLKDAGAQVNARNKKGETALIEAAKGGHLPVVQFLIDKGANAQESTISGRKPLMDAAEKGHMEILKFLLQHLKGKFNDPQKLKVEVNDMDLKGSTAWDLALANKHEDCLKELEAYGALNPEKRQVDNEILNKIVWIAPFGDRYHKLGCSFLDEARAKGLLKSKTIKQAELEGYIRCLRWES